MYPEKKQIRGLEAIFATLSEFDLWDFWVKILKSEFQRENLQIDCLSYGDPIYEVLLDIECWNVYNVVVEVELL